MGADHVHESLTKERKRTPVGRGVLSNDVLFSSLLSCRKKKGSSRPHLEALQKKCRSKSELLSKSLLGLWLVGRAHKDRDPC